MSQSAFRWSDFVRLADILCQSSEEAYSRSCISRAYYGAFNSAKAIARVTSGGVDAHQTVPGKLKETGIRQYKVAAGMLEGLRKKRNNADYDIDIPQTKQSVEASLREAHKIIELLNTSQLDLEYE